MRTNNDIQQTIVAYLKAQPTLVSYLANSSQIKEDQWQGVNFVYPAIRVEISIQSPYPGNDCSIGYVNFSVWTFTDDSSSKNCDKISGEVNNLLHDHQIYGIVDLFSITSMGLGSAIRQDERTWSSQAQFRALVK